MLSNHLTSAQQCALADRVCGALAGWLLDDTRYGRAAQQWRQDATAGTGFDAGQFLAMAIGEVSRFYRLTGSPVSVREAAALARLIQSGLASDATLYGATLIAGQTVPGWRDKARDALRDFCIDFSAAGAAQRHAE